MNFGIIIHYGIYSFYEYDYDYDYMNRAKRQRKSQNNSDWYFGRLIDYNDFIPNNECFKKYQKNNTDSNIENSETNNNMDDYFENLDKLTTDENKVKEWVNIAKSKGASYIILTSKHHDGVLLFDSKSSSIRSKMDICKVFSETCKKENIPFGFYYSWFEFGVPFNKTYFKNYCVPQLQELLSYDPNYMWFDGDWKIKQKTIQKEINDMVKDMKKTKNIIVNDRIGRYNTNEASYRVISDKFVPKSIHDIISRQYMNNVGYSWGNYNNTTKSQKVSEYQSKSEIHNLCKEVGELGGTLLINLCPNDESEIEKEDIESLQLLIQN
jgi:alpha-L-fucosidase